MMTNDNFPYLGLKASTDPAQIAERLRYSPTVFEFFTTPADCTPAGLNHLQKMIEWVQHTTHRIVIHHPMSYRGHHVEVSTPARIDPAMAQFVTTSTQDLLKVAREMDVQLLIHGSYNAPVQTINAEFGDVATGRQAVLDELDHWRDVGGDHIMFENSISPIYPYSDPVFNQAILAHHYRLAFDTSHTFIAAHGNNDVLVASLQQLAPAIVHYHLVDSMGQFHDSLPLGQGRIDWARVWPTLNQTATNIYEITLANQLDSTAQRASHTYLEHIKAAAK
ncbi:MAG: TIM barrel protein [Schleiferilactobacillus harbinensis]|jgi:sugar phosphate isomerase/epimerase|nr:TIM barrel protein [Schleiferilactobacillus harbinensis]MCI1913786.1 TIM barrel protein [Schleiferilactobacillus harbinensis]